VLTRFIGSKRRCSKVGLKSELVLLTYLLIVHFTGSLRCSIHISGRLFHFVCAAYDNMFIDEWM